VVKHLFVFEGDGIVRDFQGSFTEFLELDKEMQVRRFHIYIYTYLFIYFFNTYSLYISCVCIYMYIHVCPTCLTRCSDTFNIA
jgi:hypothetical protein